MAEAARLVSQLPGGQGIAELTLLQAHAGRHDAAARGIKGILDIARAQHGVLITTHPTAVLEVAEYALEHLGDEASSLRLVNMAFGLRPGYAALDDVERLGNLLSRLHAPAALWADWGAIFIRHIHFSNSRPQIFINEFDDHRAAKWAVEQDAASEHSLRRLLALAPREVHELLARLAPHLNAADLASIVREQFAASDLPGGPPECDALWFDAEVLRFRYFWYDMISESEQHLVRNGDWAMFRTPTPDFSMALAQWWRTLESVLKRPLASGLNALFAANPEWVEWDRQNLSDRAKKRESIFIDKLTDPEKAEKLTLAELVLILRKCLSEGSAGGSRLRREAARHLGLHRKELQPLISDSWFDSTHLSERNISFFRNRSSHDQSVDFADAAVGRLLARRSLDVFHMPVLEAWGFVPKMVVWELGPTEWLPPSTN